MKGITFNPKTGKYYARVYRGGKEYYGGSHDTEEAAIAARNEIAAKIGNGQPVSESVRTKYEPNDYNGCAETYFYDCVSSVFLDNPEYELRYWLMIGALQDLRSKKPKIKREAIRWIRGDIKSPPTYSFIEICDLFRVNADEARSHILKNVDQIKVKQRRSLPLKKAA